MTVAEVLKEGSDTLSPRAGSYARLEAEVLLAEAVGFNRAKLYASLWDTLDSRQEQRFNRMVERRLTGEPVAYILGRKEFMGFDFEVNPFVLIPRPETELLVEKAVEFLRKLHRPVRVLDIGTGSGCIAISLAKHLEEVTVVATDVCQKALRVARKNTQRLGVSSRITFLAGNLYDPIRLNGHDLAFDAILSNPPYIPEEDVSRLAEDIREYEPRVALLSGNDGLSFIHAVIQESPRYLRQGGLIALEVGDGQAMRVGDLVRSTDEFEPPAFWRDLTDRLRVVTARRARERAWV